MFTDIARRNGAAWLPLLTEAGHEPVFVPDSGIGEQTRALRELLPAGEPALIHSQYNGLDIASARALRGRGQDGLVWHLRSDFPPGALAWARAVTKYAVWGRRVDAFLCVAPHIPDQLRRRGAGTKRSHFFPNGTDVDRFVNSPWRRDEVRARLGLAPEALVLLHYGWEWERKGGDLVAESLPLIESDRPVVVVTVGGGQDAERAAARLGLGDRLRSVEAVADVRELHAAADVFLSPSEREGLTWGVIESLVSGLGVVASDIPGHRVIAEGATGLELHGADPAELAAAVGRLAQRDEATRAADVEAARAWVRDVQSIERWQRRLIEVYERATA